MGPLAPLHGEPVATGALTIPRSRAFEGALSAGIPYVTLVECRSLASTAGAEAIIFDVEAEIPQRPIHDVRPIERVMVTFHADDGSAPVVQLLRTTFPLVPHLNLTAEEIPRSPCLYDEPWTEAQRAWTPADFVLRLRRWLALTARDELHAQDQPLEPLLSGAAWPLVAPAELLGGEETDSQIPAPLRVRKVLSDAGYLTLFAEIAPSEVDATKPEAQPEFLATTFRADPQAHGVIRRQPRTLRELADLLTPAGIDLVDQLRTRVRAWHEGLVHVGLLQARLIVILALPKSRVAGGPVESTETWGFLISQTIGEVGEQLGIWEMRDGQPGRLLHVDETKQGEQVPLELLNPTPSFSRARAAALSGKSQSDARRITAVGAGALGSQLFLDLLRRGFGEWTLIDPDVLLPHNLARHPLFGAAVGLPKAEALALLANDIVDGEPVARFIVADVLAPGTKTPQVEEALVNADIVVDASASVAVARYLSRDVESAARRVSAFLNPTGTDAVLLVEDAARTTPLDLLEMQYYRHLVQEPTLNAHIAPNDGQVRYGVSCRDESSTIPQDLVALHAATAARMLRRSLGQEEARIYLWRALEDEPGVATFPIQTAEPVAILCGDWTVYTDRWLLDQLQRWREEKLPNETGGVLVGAFDTQRKIVYVVDALPSPPDSVEWPTLYIRGCEGLRSRVEVIGAITAGNLVYAGEWHSHPKGVSCSPSNDDRTVFAWLEDLRAGDGLPPLMLIVGDADEGGWYLGSMPSGSAEDRGDGHE
jgi:integrative and conjugative element protein (TIGR02256 family)